MKILLMTLFLAFACSKNDGKNEKSNSYSTDEEYQLIQEYLDLVNDHRSSLGLRPLIQSPEMEYLAQTHSVQMGKGIVDFGHDHFQERCLKIKERYQSGNLCAENVARYQRSPQDVLRAWLSSSSHSKNINSSRHTHTGVGVFINEKGEYYWTQLFLEVR